MRTEPRPIADCPYRTPPTAGTTLARCGLLEQVIGSDPGDLRLCGVTDEACEACSREFPPSRVEWNPVIASLLYRAAGVLRARGEAERAAGLHARAVGGIPSEIDVRSRPEQSPGADSSDLAALVPPPRNRSGPPVRRWAVGVTTAARGVPTLRDCLESLVAAGWSEARLFVDGEGVEIPEPYRAWPRTERTPRMGAWPSYYLALGELLLREPQADAYLMVQDDALFFAHGGLRSYLEDCVLWPGRGEGVVSLFCSRADTPDQPGWTRHRGVWVWCALAFVFSRSSAQRFLADPDVMGHRWTAARNPMADIDWRIGQWAFDRGVPLHFPAPSLVQHIGEVSALWPGVRLLGNRRASWFAGAPGSGPPRLSQTGPPDRPSADDGPPGGPTGRTSPA
jgi:hypothetical protein